MKINLRDDWYVKIFAIIFWKLLEYFQVLFINQTDFIITIKALETRDTLPLTQTQSHFLHPTYTLPSQSFGQKYANCFVASKIILWILRFCYSSAENEKKQILTGQLLIVALIPSSSHPMGDWCGMPAACLAAEFLYGSVFCICGSISGLRAHLKITMKQSCFDLNISCSLLCYHFSLCLY